MQIPIIDSHTPIQNIETIITDNVTTNNVTPSQIKKAKKLAKNSEKSLIKTKKLIEYVDVYKKDKKLDEEETKNLVSFLKDCLDKKKLQRVKDVIYDKITGSVKDIPALYYTKSNKHFTLKNIDKRVSTLKSLAPKKTQRSIKNKLETPANNNDSETDDEN